MRVLVFMLLSVTTGVAQRNYGFEEAFIMMKDGSSFKGFIVLASAYGSKIGYKKELTDVETSISTKEIKFIMTPDRYLENIAFGKRELLMTLITDGKTRLFLQVVSNVGVRPSRFGPAPYESLAHTFVLQKGSINTEVTRKRFREILSALMFDCPEVVQKLREGAFVYEQMDQAVMEYNSCF